MRRRGYTPTGINKFCEQVSVTRRGNENFVSIKLLEHYIRNDLDDVAKRTLAVIDPVPVHILDVSENFE